MARKVVAIVAFVVFTSLCVAGCTSSTNTTSVGQHDAFLEKFLTAYQKEEQQNYSFNESGVKWVNSTTANLQFAYGNGTAGTNMSVIHFKSAQDATSYVNGLNKTGYSLVSTSYNASNASEVSIAYAQAAGHAPAIYKDYEGATIGTLPNITFNTIEQLDDLVVVYTLTPVFTS